MLFDRKFDEYLLKNHFPLLKADELNSWQNQRDSVMQTVNSVSFYALGLVPERGRWYTFLTHQFLHGDIMHLVGNMVFLVLFGFVVEAALGAWRFLATYLIGGLGAAGFHYSYLVLSGGDLSTPMVGASGAISAVMAMYVVLYRLKAIEFFYWIFMFAGYFKAPALIILPLYIAFEVLKSLMIEGSNVAYMAHIGGFIAGAILIFLIQAFFQNEINEEYLEDKVEIDPFRQDLDKVYNYIASFNLHSAYKQNEVLYKKYGNRPEVEELRLNLLKGLSKSSLSKFLLSRLKQQNNLSSVVKAQVALWKQLDTEAKNEVSVIQQLNLAIAALSIEEAIVAKEIYKSLRAKDQLLDKFQPKMVELNNAFIKFYQTHSQEEMAQKFVKKNMELNQFI